MHQSKWIILTIIIACQLIVVLDASIMVTAVPQIGHSLHMTATSLTWVHNGYILPFGGFLLLGARAGDLLGRRRMLSVGIGLFSLASMLAGLAPTAEFLLVSRAFQGFAAALTTPAALALLSASFVEAKERSRAIAVYSAVSAGGGSIGLILGGFFTDFISWRVGMFINVPIGIALLYLVQRFIQKTDTRTGRFDLWGAVTSVIGMTALVYGFIQAADQGWGKPETLISLAAGIVLLAVFVLIEARTKEPIIPLRLFASRQRTGAYLGRFLLLCGNFSLFFFIPQFLQNVLDFSSFEAGLAFLPFNGAMFGMLYLMPRLVHRFGNIKVLIAGLLLAIIGTAWMSQIVSIHVQFFPQMFILLAIMGIGTGMALQPFTSLGLSDVDSRDTGAASGLINVAHQSGSSLGLAVLITVFDAAIRTTGQPSKLQFAHAISDSILGSAVFITSALVATLFYLLPAHQPARKQSLIDS
ncbi:MFS transporter [Paenibacillus beijingensis]|uniref:MFS transporter n=2 Tax=Paenibacillus beijingensis TaxID=1126833 RepID=A0A0D5NRW4_9BACL|nr:MFS transporter [Paenibacillus beijingensis]